MPEVRADRERADAAAKWSSEDSQTAGQGAAGKSEERTSEERAKAEARSQNAEGRSMFQNAAGASRPESRGSTIEGRLGDRPGNR